MQGHIFYPKNEPQFHLNAILNDHSPKGQRKVSRESTGSQNGDNDRTNPSGSEFRNNGLTLSIKTSRQQGVQPRTGLITRQRPQKLSTEYA